MEKSDILRVAATLLEEHGERAADIAGERARSLIRLGNTQGASSWLKVIAAIEELSRVKPPDETLH